MSCGHVSVKHTRAGMSYNADFEEIVHQNSLLDFDSVLHLDEAEIIKHATPERKTVKISLRGAGGVFEAYLKRHYPVSFWTFLGRLLKGSMPHSAYDEFENIIAFHRAGISTMKPVAAGIRKSGFFQSTSFLVTQALESCTRLDHLFSKPSGPSLEKKREIITKVALAVKKMHACGFNHRDLYLCHLLFKTTGELFIVDLHRVDRREQVPERWKVKDIAALNYSAPRHIISRTDRFRFLKTYLGTEYLSEKNKLFALKVLKKTKKMVEHNRHRTGKT